MILSVLQIATGYNHKTMGVHVMTIQFFTPRGPGNEVLRLPSSLRRSVKWLPQIGDTFPDFTVDTTQGPLRFWDWAEGSWVHLFSHPGAYTSVCTTELAALADCSSECQAINLKNLALTGATVEDQRAWHEDIHKLFGCVVDFPGASDLNLKLSQLFGMVHDKQEVSRPIRKSFLIDPALQVRLIFEYPTYIGRNIDEVLRVTKAIQLHDRTGAYTPADWDHGDLVIVPDTLPESEVRRHFASDSVRLTPYLRVVEPKSHLRLVSGTQKQG
jgi:alkyl hydroperoxide reductase subunit AhpC